MRSCRATAASPAPAIVLFAAGATVAVVANAAVAATAAIRYRSRSRRLPCGRHSSSRNEAGVLHAQHNAMLLGNAKPRPPPPPPPAPSPPATRHQTQKSEGFLGRVDANTAVLGAMAVGLLLAGVVAAVVGARIGSLAAKLRNKLRAGRAQEIEAAPSARVQEF